MKAVKKNGVPNIDTPMMEDMRQRVVEQELVARSWKALYEKMHYTLECEKLIPLYEEYMEKVKKEKEEAEKKHAEFLAKLQEQIEKGNEEAAAGKISLEPAKTTN